MQTTDERCWGRVTMTSEHPVDRLTPEQRADLDHFADLWRADGLTLTVEEYDVLARYLLRELSLEECVARIVELES
jgi:hypothetical protein